MAGDSDIRNWARDHGINIADRGRVPADVRQQYQAHLPANGSAPGPAETEPDGQTQTPAEPAARPAPATAGETRPKPTQASRGWFRRDPDRKTKRKPRTSLEQLGAAAYGLAGQALTRTRLYAAGRVLTMQAPIAGIVAEEELRGTPVDTIAQPLARLMEKGGTLGALMLLPTSVAAYQLSGGNDALIPVIRWSFLQQLKMNKAYEAEIQKRMDKALADAGVSEEELEAGLAALFAPPQAVPQEEPAAA